MSKVMPKILFIEDERDYRSSLVDYMRLEGFDVIEAENGKQALAKISQENPDLILCDVMLPDINGFDIYDEYARQRRENPFIFLSALNQKDNNFRTYSGETLDYVNKPVDFDVLPEF